MRAIDRKLVTQAVAIGLAAALVIMLAGWIGLLDPMERWLYDQRARWCQFAAPRPTDQLMHLDIDDLSLEAIGRFPWPRRSMARIIDELHRAGPAVIALDIVFPEPEPVTHETVPDTDYAVRGDGMIDGPFRRVMGDRELADAVTRAGNVLLPVYFRIEPRPAPIVAAAVEELTKDLELTPIALHERLRRHGSNRGDSETSLPSKIYLPALEEATSRRVSEALGERECSQDELRARLLPRTDPDLGGSIQLRQLAMQFDKVHRLRALRRHALARPASAGSPLSGRVEFPAIRPLGEAAALTGSLHYRADADGVVRSIPLWLEEEGWLYPQVGLALACHMLGVQHRDIEFQPDRIVLRPAGHEPIVVPVRHAPVPESNTNAGLFLDIPWFGPTERWQVMYDPARRAPAQHRSINEVWQIIQTEEKIARNSRNIDRALSAILDNDQAHKLGFDPARAAQYARQPLDPHDTASRLPRVERTLTELRSAGWLEHQATTREHATTPPDDGRSAELHAAVKVLLEAPAHNAALLKQLEQQRQTLRSALAGKAALVGWTATGVAADFVPTSLHSKCPGPVVHGVIFNSIMTGHFLRRAPGWVTAATTLLVSAVMVLVVARIRTPMAGLLVAMLFAGGYLVVNGLFLYDYGNIVVGAAMPTAGMAAAWLATTIWRHAVEVRERRRVTARFQSYVDPALVQYVLDHPEQAQLEGQVRELTVVFTDLADFTQISESLREKTVGVINEYLSVMVPLIKANKGLVNKFLGDGIMFFYGAPETNEGHAVCAVTTVLDMQAAMVEFNRGLEGRGLPRLALRAGVSTGPMIVGDAGGSDRCDYTVLGDAVNLASRLESANKALGTRILITQRTVDLIGDRFLIRPVAHLKVVGKSRGAMVYEPLATEAVADDAMRRRAAATRTMVEAFAAGQFQSCVEAADVLDQAAGPESLASLYRRLSRQHLQSPPGPDFDGHISLTEK